MDESLTFQRRSPVRSVLDVETKPYPWAIKRLSTSTVSTFSANSALPPLP
jgi:hypothetical protein